MAHQMTITRPVGPQEIAVLHGSPTSTAWRWKGRDNLPAPAFRVSGHDVWELTTIEVWSKQTRRTPTQTRWDVAIGTWARHLGRMVPDGEGGLVPDPKLTFTELYDLLQLGQEQTRLGEIGMPVQQPAGAGV
jgi:hypothetical protein